MTEGPLIILLLREPAALPRPVIFLLLAIATALIALAAWRNSRRKDSSPSPGSVRSSSDDGERQFRTLLELPRPRPVRLSARGKSSLIVLAAGLLLLVIVLALMVSLPGAGTRRSIAPNRMILVYVVPLGLVAILALLMRRGLAREKKLLAQGELALGRVTRQWRSRNGNGIRYEFSPAGGQLISRSCTDYSRQFSEGMAVPVFYQAGQPNKQVALCGSFYEIVAPGQEQPPTVRH